MLNKELLLPNKPKILQQEEPVKVVPYMIFNDLQECNLILKATREVVTKLLGVKKRIKKKRIPQMKKKKKRLRSRTSERNDEENEEKCM